MTTNDCYIPCPLDADNILLPDEIQRIIEPMAKIIHEEWAKQCIAQGWTYGDERNDTLKTHPCLVPYEELPEQEKDYDRNTCIATIKYLLKNGFTISK